jgi:hypothetical protein
VADVVSVLKKNSGESRARRGEGMIEAAPVRRLAVSALLVTVAIIARALAFAGARVSVAIAPVHLLAVGPPVADKGFR